MKLTIVLVSRGGHEQNFEMETRRAPRNLDALIEASYNAKHTVLTKVLEEGADSYLLSFSEVDTETLQDAVDTGDYDDLPGYDLSLGEVDSLIEDHISTADEEKTIYVYEFPAESKDEDEYEDEDGEDEDGGSNGSSDRELLTIIVKVHGGAKETVHVPHGTTFERIIQKSGVSMPAGASLAFNGNDVTMKDGAGAGGQLTASGKVVGG